MQPLVSVLLNSYNRPKLIRDAIESVLAQTWPNIQIIVVDDHSNAETVQVIRAGYQEPMLKKWLDHGIEPEWDGFVFVQPPTQPTSCERQFGQRCSVCINAAMQYARGDFVAYLPDDDFLMPTGIEVRARYLMEHPEANVVYGRLEACKSDRPVVGIHLLEMGDDFWQTDGVHAWRMPPECVHDRNGFWSAEPVTRAANKVDHNMFMVRRVPNLPDWPERRLMDTHTGEVFDCPDAGFLFRCELAGLGPFYSVPDVVAVKRYHALHHRTDPGRRE